jgi:hypothetical protein
MELLTEHLTAYLGQHPLPIPDFGEFFEFAMPGDYAMLVLPCGLHCLMCDSGGGHALLVHAMERDGQAWKDVDFDEADPEANMRWADDEDRAAFVLTLLAATRGTA